jgi:hypothetical protein
MRWVFVGGGQREGFLAVGAADRFLAGSHEFLESLSGRRERQLRSVKIGPPAKPACQSTTVTIVPAAAACSDKLLYSAKFETSALLI